MGSQQSNGNANQQVSLGRRGSQVRPVPELPGAFDSDRTHLTPHQLVGERLLTASLLLSALVQELGREPWKLMNKQTRALDSRQLFSWPVQAAV